MSTTLADLRQKLHADEHGERIRALSESRSLNMAERFELVCLAVNDAHSRVRYDAISQLATVGNQDLEQSLAILINSLNNDPEIDVRAAAADSIGALKLISAFDALQVAYQSSNDWIMQLSIVAALGELGDPKGFDFLVDVLANNSNEIVKIAAIGSLGELGDPRAVDLLLPLVTNPDWQIRHRIAQALAYFDRAEAKNALVQLSQDSVAQVAEIAKTLLEIA